MTNITECNIIFPSSKVNYQYNKELYAHDITCFMNKHTTNYFLGCFAADDIPWKKLDKLRNQGRSWALIMNFDKRTQGGSHYTALACAALNKKLYYYDSLALTNGVYADFTQFLLHYKNKIWTNITTFEPHQDSQSSACGYYCIWFLLTMWTKNPSFQKMTQLCRPMEQQAEKHNNNQYVVNKIRHMIWK